MGVLQRISLPALLALGLTACGGGGGGAASAPAAAGAAAPVPVPGLSLLAGTVNAVGSADGVGDLAQFSNPTAVAADASGNAYVIDSANNTVRKVTPAGRVTTLAGSAGQRGSADGTGAAARFDFTLDQTVGNATYLEQEGGIAVDAGGTVYVADTGNNTIRKITPAGVVTTLAGTAGVTGSSDGTGAAAQFDAPHWLAVDGSGNVYVSDGISSWSIREISSTGVVTTLAPPGGLPGIAPQDLVVSAQGTVYFSNTSGIFSLAPGGSISKMVAAGSSSDVDGPLATAQFESTDSIALDGSGNLYVEEEDTGSVREISATGKVSTLVQGRVFGVIAAGAGGVLVLPGFGIGADGIGSVSATGVVTVLAGGGVTAGSYASGLLPASFGGLNGVAVNPTTGTIAVIDPYFSAVYQVSAAGAVTQVNPDPATGTTAPFVYEPTNELTAIAIDGSGNTFVGAVGPFTMGCVLEFSASLPSACSSSNAFSSFGMVSGLAVDAADNVYVADRQLNTISSVTPVGVVTLLAGTAGVRGGGDGQGSAAQFSYPMGLALDSVGNLYVADAGNYTIRKISPKGLVITLAGLAGSPGSADGLMSAARFSNPEGVAVDSAGNVYVADTGNYTIRKITPAGQVSTVVGAAGLTQFVAGVLPGGLMAPTGVAVLPGDVGLVVTMATAVAVVRF